MSDIDEKKPTGKAGKRKRQAEQRRNSEQKPPQKLDHAGSDPVQTPAVLTTSADTALVAAKAAKTKPGTLGTTPTPVIAAVEPVPVILHTTGAQAATAILATESIAAATHHTTEPPVVPIVSAAHASAPPAAPIKAVEIAPIKTPKVEEKTVASAAPQFAAAPMPADAAPVRPAETPVSLQTLATAYGDYTRKSLEQAKCFIDKLTGVRSIEQAVEIQTEFAKQACETFVAEAKRIQDLHRELARQRLEGLMTLTTPLR